MSGFNDFIQTELPKRPFTNNDGTAGQLLARSTNPLAPRELVWIDATSISGGVTKHAFSWGDATPALILTVPAGKAVLKVEVVLEVPFNVASTITVGDSGNHSQLFGVDDIDTTSVGTYQTNPGYKYMSDTAINLYITLGGGVSAGSGLILIYLEV